MPPVWILSSLAMLVLQALGLRISVAAVTGKGGSSNPFGKALLVSAALTLFSIGVRGAVPDAVIGGIVMLALWLGVVHWAYKLRLVETLLVAGVMLVLSLGVVHLLGILARALG